MLCQKERPRSRNISGDAIASGTVLTHPGNIMAGSRAVSSLNDDESASTPQQHPEYLVRSQWSLLLHSGATIPETSPSPERPAWNSA